MSMNYHRCTTLLGVLSIGSAGCEAGLDAGLDRAAESEFREGKSHTVLDCGPPPNSPDTVVSPSTLSTEAKRYILCRMNQVRSEVALGVREGAYGEYLPVATDMRRLQWDDDLATVATSYASQCKFEHNAQRSAEYAAWLGVPSSDVYVGENLYVSSVDPVLNMYYSDKDYGISGGLQGWFDESLDYDYDDNDSVGGAVGHFTQVAWAETTRVGCGFSYCPGGVTTQLGVYSWARTNLVCNYHEGQYSGSPYQAGASLDDVCTEGIQPGNTCENGLITPAPTEVE